MRYSYIYCLTRVMHRICKNCQHQLAASSKFCAACGQSALTERLDLKRIAHDFSHAFFHADKGFFLLVRRLATNPGEVARRYVAGERTWFFSPFNFLLINGTIFLFLGHHVQNLNPLHNDPFAAFLENYSKMILLFSLPLLAALSWLFFQKANKN